MAADLTPGVGGWFEDFVNGPTGNANEFVSFPSALRDNFALLRTTFNQLNAEFRASIGQANAFINDLLFPDIVLTLNDGRVGITSFVVTTKTTATITLTAGVASIGGVRVSGVSQAVNAAGLPATTAHFISVDVNGVLSIATSIPLGQIGLYGVDTAGAGLFDTGSVEDLVQTFFDGDEWLRMRTRPTNSTFPVTDDPEPPLSGTVRYLGASRRLDNLELILSGRDTNPDLDVPALPAIRVPGGAVATPGLLFTDGSGTEEEVGLYRSAVDELSVATQSTQVVRFDPNGNIDLVENARVKGNRTAAQTVTDGSTANIAFTAADDWDIGNLTTDVWHNHSGGGPGDEEFTVPTGGDGLYTIILNVEWDTSVTNQRDISMRITVNGTTEATVSHRTEVGEVYADAFPAHHEMVATDVVRASVTHTDITGALSLDITRASLSVVKVA